MAQSFNSVSFYGADGGVANGVPMSFQPYNTSEIYNSVLELDRISLETLTPWITGRGFLIPDTMAAFMELVFPDQTEQFKALMVTYCTGIDGITQLQAQTQEVNSGIEAQTMEVTTGLTGATKEITMTFPAELRGQFIRRYISYWLKGIYDPQTSRMTLLGAIDRGMRATEANVVASGIYFTTEPSFKEVEYSAYYCNASPKSANTDINNYKRGEHNISEVQVPFKCQWHDDNKFIHSAAKTYLDKITSKMSNFHEYKFRGL